MIQKMETQRQLPCSMEFLMEFCRTILQLHQQAQNANGTNSEDIVDDMVNADNSHNSSVSILTMRPCKPK